MLTTSITTDSCVIKLRQRLDIGAPMTDSFTAVTVCVAIVCPVADSAIEAALG